MLILPNRDLFLTLISCVLTCTGEVCLLHLAGREIIDNGQLRTLVIRKPSRQQPQESPSSALPNSLPLAPKLTKSIQNP
jgi:hypothetical protein